MKKLIPALALLTLCASVWLTPTSASAVPKMDVKVAVGVGSTRFVPRVPTIHLYEGDDPMNPGPYLGTVGGRNAGNFPTWGLKLAARVTAGKIFGEIGAGFSRFYFEFGEQLELLATIEGGNPELIAALVGQTVRMNSMQIPLTAGYVPLQEPLLQTLPLRRLGQHVQHSGLRRRERQSQGVPIQAQRHPWLSTLDLCCQPTPWCAVRPRTAELRCQLRRQPQTASRRPCSEPTPKSSTSS